MIDCIPLSFIHSTGSNQPVDYRVVWWESYQRLKRLLKFYAGGLQPSKQQVSVILNSWLVVSFKCLDLGLARFLERHQHQSLSLQTSTILGLKVERHQRYATMQRSNAPIA